MRFGFKFTNLNLRQNQAPSWPGQPLVNAAAAQGVDWQDVNVVIEIVQTVEKPSNCVDANP
jgi:hypothetical protein